MSLVGPSSPTIALHISRVKGDPKPSKKNFFNSFFFVAYIIPILILYLFPKFYVTVILIFSVMMDFAHTH